MAVNEREEWPTEHTCYLGMTGSGKSQALAQNAALPASGRFVLWDAQGTQSIGAVVCQSRAEFLGALAYAISASQTRFRVSYRPDMMADLAAEFEWWCSVVWRILDGRYRTYAVVEELGAACRGNAKAERWLYNMLTIGRKYGLVLHWTSQRAASVPKTATAETRRRVIGMADPDMDVRRMASMAGVDIADMQSLRPLEFWVRELPGPSKPLRLRYKKQGRNIRKTAFF